LPRQVASCAQKASNQINAEAAASNPDFKKMYENLMAFRDKEYEWWQVADFTYDNFMIRSRSLRG
jgi:TRAP-type mannitol/chloroaromatic compound transport system substrate-binding protein